MFIVSFLQFRCANIFLKKTYILGGRGADHDVHRHLGPGGCTYGGAVRGPLPPAAPLGHRAQVNA